MHNIYQIQYIDRWVHFFIFENHTVFEGYYDQADCGWKSTDGR